MKKPKRVNLSTRARVSETLGSELEGWTEKRAEETLEERRVQVRKEGRRKLEPTTFEVFAREWLATYPDTKDLKRSTTEGYRSIIEGHLIPELGQLQLPAVDVAQLDRYLTKKRAEGLAPPHAQQAPEPAPLAAQGGRGARARPFQPRLGRRTATGTAAALDDPLARRGRAGGARVRRPRQRGERRGAGLARAGARRVPDRRLGRRPRSRRRPQPDERGRGPRSHRRNRGAAREGRRRPRRRRHRWLLSSAARVGARCPARLTWRAQGAVGMLAPSTAASSTRVPARGLGATSDAQRDNRWRLPTRHHEGDRPRHLRLARRPAAQGDRQARGRRWRRARPRARGWRGPGRLAPDGRAAVPGAGRRRRAPRSPEPRPRR